MKKYCQLNIRLSEEDLRILRYRMEYGRYKNMSQYLRELINKDKSFSPVGDTDRVDWLIGKLSNLNDRLRELEVILGAFKGIDVNRLGDQLTQSVEKKLDRFFRSLDTALSKLNKRTESAAYNATYMKILFIIFVKKFFLAEGDHRRAESWKEAVKAAHNYTLDERIEKNESMLESV